MSPTPYPDANDLLERLLAQMRAILGGQLTGLYLYGSLATGDFDPGISDIDLLAALTDDLDAAQFDALDTMHSALVAAHPQWDDRIEIAYLSLHGLRTFRTEASPIGIISPGEPFHIKGAGKEWLVNWYMVHEIGVTLYGPPPRSIIAPVSQAEFIATIRAHAAAWREWVMDGDSRPFQAYAVLTLCRALYTCTHGEQVSKRQAVAWAAQTLPQWAAAIQNALAVRQAARAPAVEDEADALAETRRFVHFVIDRIFEKVD